MNNGVVSVITKRTLPVLTRRIGRQRLILKKQSPHIFFTLGVMGSVTSTVLACRATLKLPDTITEIEKDVAGVKELGRDKQLLTDTYTEKDLNRDTFLVYTKAAYKLGRLYGPAIGVGVLSISALTGSHVAMSRRNTALMAAYTTLSEAFANYRERVIAELGAEQELDIYHARVKIDDQDEDTCVVDPTKWSPYARFFDEGSSSFEKNAELNRLFITCQQNWANEMLRARGHVLLNEVYDMLGFERTPEGCVVGWVIGGKGDDYIDFGMYEARNARFINGLERVPLLDFNVDGVVYNQI